MSRTETLLRLMGVSNKRVSGHASVDENSIVIAGFAHVPILDSQGDKFDVSRFVPNQPFLTDQYRNLMYEHTPLQVGVVVNTYVNKLGIRWTTRLSDAGFFVVAALRNDAPYMDTVIPKVLSGQVACFSIGATVTDRGIWIHEVSICAKGANPMATFSIIHR